MGWFRKKKHTTDDSSPPEGSPEWLQWGELSELLDAQEQARVAEYLQVSLSTMGQTDPWIPMLITDSGINALEFLDGHDPMTVLASVTDLLQKGPPATRFGYLCMKYMVGEQADEPAILAFVQGATMSKSVLLSAPLKFDPEKLPAASLAEPIRPMAEMAPMIGSE